MLQRGIAAEFGTTTKRLTNLSIDGALKKALKFYGKHGTPYYYSLQSTGKHE